ncbi:MAG: DUF1833 family protein [Gammaproteobacteria bacterium]|nr:DUF1833 family protein [Gammaproteobacteria bacterium]
MAVTVSTNYKTQTNRTSGTAPLILLEITHPNLPQPVRLVQDNQDIVSNGNTFTAMGFEITLPDDKEQGLPQAKIAIDNVGKELTSWLDASGGGKGAKVRVMQIMRDAPNVIEMDTTLDLSNVSMNVFKVGGTLGYQDILNQPAVTYTYRPDTAPGLF